MLLPLSYIALVEKNICLSARFNDSFQSAKSGCLQPNASLKMTHIDRRMSVCESATDTSFCKFYLMMASNIYQVVMHALMFSGFNTTGKTVLCYINPLSRKDMAVLFNQWFILRNTHQYGALNLNHTSFVNIIMCNVTRRKLTLYCMCQFREQ